MAKRGASRLASILKSEDVTGPCVCIAVGFCLIAPLGLLNATPTPREADETPVLPEIQTDYDAAQEEMRREQAEWTVAEQVRWGWFWMDEDE